MNRRGFLMSLAGIVASWFGLRGARAEDPLPPGITAVKKSDEEWRRILTREQYAILREEATEPPRSSPLNDEHREGTFVCAGCDLPLFTSKMKFDSGTGWPSFYDTIEGHVATRTDYKLIVPRTEYHCVRCGGHHGHVFKDGPPPTGLRYCNNGFALKFNPGKVS